MNFIEELLKRLGLDPTNAAHKALIDKATAKEGATLTAADIDAVMATNREKWADILKKDTAYTTGINAEVYPTVSKKVIADLTKKLGAHGVTGEFKNHAELAEAVGKYLADAAEKAKGKTTTDVDEAIKQREEELRAEFAIKIGQAGQEAQAAAAKQIQGIQEGYATADFFRKFMNGTEEIDGKKIQRRQKMAPDMLDLSKIISGKGAVAVYEGGRLVKFTKPDGTDFYNASGEKVLTAEQFAAQNFSDLYESKAVEKAKKDDDKTGFTRTTLGGSAGGHDERMAKFLADKKAARGL